jgi:hypothetical protein
VDQLASELEDWIEDGLRGHAEWEPGLALEVKPLPSEPLGARVPQGHVGAEEYEEPKDVAFACGFTLHRREEDRDATLDSLRQRLTSLFANEEGRVLDGRYESGQVSDLAEIELATTYGGERPDRAFKVWLIDPL